jgi:cytochrome c oxidase assembly protein subunit 15
LTTFTSYPQVIHTVLLKKWGLWIAILLGVQIVLGGIMSGMKAGLFYPTWPQMNGEWIPSVVLQGSEWNSLNFIHYDRGPFMSALVQLMHRSLAYMLVIIVLWYFYKAMTNAPKGPFRSALPLLPTMIFIQVLLGIFTLLYCKGTVPVGLGVFHQAGALVLLTIILFLNYHLRLDAKK